MRNGKRSRESFTDNIYQFGSIKMPSRDEIHYFGAGPAPLPTPVLEEASKVILNYNDGGVGIAEISHRSADANAILANTKSSLRQLLDIPESGGYVL